MSAALAFAVGLASTLHCLTMCGSIISALTLSLPAGTRSQPRTLLVYLGAYNGGRLLSYTVAGAIAGGLGQSLLQAFPGAGGHRLLALISALVLIGIGLYLAGWFPGFARIERLGAPVWRRLEPLGRRVIPVRSPAEATMLGLVWGWLPCGLVYTTALWAATSGSAVEGALVMLAFGLGTLPSMFAASLFMGWLSRLARNPGWRRLVGVSLVLIAVIMLLWSEARDTAPEYLII